ARHGRAARRHRFHVDAEALLEIFLQRLAQLAGRGNRDDDLALFFPELDGALPFARLGLGEREGNGSRGEHEDQRRKEMFSSASHQRSRYSTGGIASVTPFFFKAAAKSFSICGSSSSYSIIVPPSRTLARTPSLLRARQQPRRYFPDSPLKRKASCLAGSLPVLKC